MTSNLFNSFSYSSDCHFIIIIVVFVFSHRWDLTLREGCLKKGTNPQDMDYINRLDRLSQNYEKKQKLLLVSHSQLQSAQSAQLDDKIEKQRESPLISNNHSSLIEKQRYITTEIEISSNKSFESLKSKTELWKQEIKEKKLKAELKGFQSIKL